MDGRNLIIRSDRGPRLGNSAYCGIISSVFLLIAAVGCDQLNRNQASNPVVGAPPPRMPAASEPGRIRLGGGPVGGGVDGRESSSVIVPVAGDYANYEISANQVVAMVNGSPILASEVIDPRSRRPYTEILDRLREARRNGEIPQSQYERLRQQIFEGMEKNLQPLIEQRLLVGALKDMLPPEALNNIQKDNERVFAEEIQRLKKEMNVETDEQLDAELVKGGLSLEQFRENFSNQRMAYGYLNNQVKSEGVLSRRDLYDYYQEHLEDYHVPAQVRWQQILISFDEHGGRSGAVEALREAVRELQEDEPFSEVARRHSAGPRVADGGQWDWTRKGSLANGQIEEELFVLPAGKISQVIESREGFHLVKVNERTAETFKPFEEVQSEIREKLQQSAQQASSQEVLDKLLTTAVIETIFDETGGRPPAGRTAGR